MPASAAPGPCRGLRVLDLGQGPAALVGMVLADYGADVVKLEPPGGERFRSLPAALQWNRGKRSVELDLRTEEGRARAVELATTSDVLVASLRPAALTAFGLSYEALAPAAPRLVHVSITGFGPAGRYADVKAYDGVVAAVTGQFAIQNGYRPDGPIYDAVPKCTFGAAMLGLIGALAALEARERTGRGQAVETSLLRSNFVYSYTGIRPERAELLPLLSQVQGRDPHNDMPGYRIARCADGRWIQSGSAAGRIFENLLRALGLEWCIGPDRPGDRRLIELIDAAYASAPLDHWREVLDRHDAAYGLFSTTQEFMDHPQVRHNGHVVAVDDPRVGPMEQIGPLVRFVDDDWQHPGPAPAPGAHTDAVLAEAHALAGARSRHEPRATEPASAPPPGALAGTTILDLSMFAAAPGGPGLLADLGARVIKIEPPSGDPLGANAIGGNELFFRVNRNKERVVLDLKDPDGRAAFHRLVERADAVVHNFRPGVPERLGADFETLAAVNPQLVHVYAASFGSSGPDAHRPAFDAVISAMAGGEVLQAGRGNPPQQRQTTDHSALLGVAVAILLGLRARRATGRPQRIETTMLASAAYLFSDDFLRYEGKPERPVPDAGQHGLHALYRLYPVADGWVFLACTREDEWERLAAAIGRPDLTADARFATPEARAEHDDALVEVLGTELGARTTADCEALLLPRDVACVAVATSWTDALFDGRFGPQPQLTTRYELPGAGAVEQSGAAVVLSHTPGTLREPEPIGASTRRVLAEIGYDDEAVTDLYERGVVR